MPFFLLMSPLIGAEPEEPNTMAARYHKLLLKKPGNEMVFGRFMDSWLDSGSKEGLRTWLEKSAKEGGAAEWSVLAAFNEYLGEDEKALLAMNEAILKDEKNPNLKLSRAKLQARLLAFEAALVDLKAVSQDPKVGVEASKLMGMYLARSGQVDAAVAAWKEVIARFPKDEDLREDLIEVEVMEGLYEGAIENSKALVTMTRDPYQRALRQLRLGDIQILGGKREEGLKTYEAIMAATGEGTWLEREVLAQLQRVFSKDDDIQGLRDFYQKLRQTYPRRVSIRKVLARQMAVNGELKEAIALFREVLKITPGDLGNREEFIAFLEVNEKWSEAKDELNELLKQQEDDPVLWERMAQLEGKLDEVEGVKTALGKVAELRKSEVEGLIAVASLYDQAKLKEEAEKLLREGSVTFADSGEVKEALAVFLIQNKKEDEALEIWKKMAVGADREGLLRVARSLRGHGKMEVAFSILFERIEEFGKDKLVLTQLCQLATGKEEAEKVVLSGLNLIKGSESPTDLESAIRIVLPVVRRAEQEEKIRDEIEADSEAGIAARCLLAELYSQQGDSLKAQEILENAEKKDQGLMVRFYRVHFEENQGNLEGAIKLLREIVESPKGRKTVHMRRLVNLLDTSGQTDEALAAVDDWKKMAPGDHLAWLRRADLLKADGQADEAVVELRRMIGKFGPDQDRRARLAMAHEEAGDFQPAQRIYEQLYEEAEKLEGKLRWVGELAELSEQEGTLEELLEDFDRRKRTNPKSVAPLLAIAEIHRVLDQYEERRSALLEASRRRPNDTSLLVRIAEEEERAGEFDRAVGILREAVKLDRTTDSKRRLANLLISNGEIQSGLGVIRSIPGQVDDPRKIEKTVLALAKNQELEIAQDYLEGALEKHGADWRLQYLLANLMTENAEEERAYQIFLGLREAEGELKGVKPLIQKQIASRYATEWNAIFGDLGWDKLFPFQRYLRNQNRVTGMHRSPAFTPTLPGTVEEARVLGVLKAATLGGEFSAEKREAEEARWNLPGVRKLGLWIAVSSNREAAGEAITKELKKAPDDKSMLILWLTYGGAGSDDAELFKKAKDFMLENHPEMLGRLLVGLMWQKSISEEEGGEIFERVLDAVKGEERLEILGSIAQYAFRDRRYYGNSNVPDFSMMKGRLAKEALALTESPKNPHWLVGVVSYLLEMKRGDEAVTLINSLCEWDKKNVGQTGTGGMSPFPSFGRQRQSKFLVAPSLSYQGLAGIPMNLGRIFQMESEDRSQLSDEQAALLAQLEDGKNEEKSGNPFASLEGKILQINHPLLRVLAFQRIGEKEKGKKEAEQLLESRDKNHLFFAASYLQIEKDPRVYDVLRKLRMMALTRQERKQVDGNLAFIGSQLMEADDKDFDVDVAKRAALRLRKTIIGNERKTLTKVLEKLGLEKEAERLATVPKPKTSSRTSMRSVQPQSELKRFVDMAREGKSEEAVRIGLKAIRNLQKQQYGSYYFNEFVEAADKYQLSAKILLKADPGETESIQRRLEFAQLNKLFKKKEAAREIYEAILKERPKELKAQIGLLQVTPPKEISPDSLLLKKEDGSLDAMASAEVFSALWESDRNSSELVFALCDLTAKYLNLLPPNGDTGRNLSFVPYHILGLANSRSVGGKSVHPLVRRSGHSSGDKDEKMTAERDAKVKAVFLAMIKHPQIAEQGFQLLESASKQLKLKEEELAAFARTALLARITLKNYGASQSQYDLWSKRSGNGSTSSGELEGGVSPVNYLMGVSLRNDVPFLNEELLAKLKEAQPEKFETLEKLQAICNASAEESGDLYLSWKESLPKVNRHLAFEELVRLMVMVNPDPAPWMSEMQKEFIGHYEDGWGSRKSWSSVRKDWGMWIIHHQGEEKYRAYIETILEGAYGDKKNWPILVKLGSDKIPQKYRRFNSSIGVLFGLLLEENELISPTLGFLSEFGLDGMIGGVSRSMRSVWGVRYGEPKKTVERLKERKLLSSSKSSKEPGYLLMLCEGFAGLSLSGSSHRDELYKLLREEKDFDPVLREFAAISLHPTEGRKEILSVLEKEIELLSQMISLSRPRSLQVLKKWFPGYQAVDAGPKLSKLLSEFRKDQLKVSREEANEWLSGKKEIPIDDHDGSEFWQKVHRITASDPEIAEQLAVKAFLAVKEESQGSSRLEAWSEELFDDYWRDSTTLSIPVRVKMMDHIYRAESGKFLLEPGKRDWSIYYSLWGKLETQIGKAKVEKDSPEIPLTLVLRQSAEGLDVKEQATLMVLLWKSLADRWVGAGKNSFAVAQWVDQEFRKEFPGLADALCALLYVKGEEHWPKEHQDTRVPKAREYFQSFLAKGELPVALRIELIGRTAESKSAEFLLGDSVAWQSIIETLKEYGKGERDFSRSYVNRFLTKVSLQTFIGKDKVAGPLAKAAFQALVEGGRQSDRETGVKKTLVTLALQGNEPEVYKKILQKDSKSMRGSARIMLELVRSGDLDLIPRLVPPVGLPYDTAHVPKYSQTYHNELQKLLEVVPEKHRYRLEVLFSARTNTKEDVYPVSHSDRLKAFAVRFKDLGPKVPTARLEILEKFAQHWQVAPLVADDLRKEAKRQMLSVVLDLEDSGDGYKQAASLRKIIAKVILLDLQDGDFTSAHDQVGSLVPLAEGNDSWDANRMANEFYGVIGEGLVRYAVKGPGEADKALAEIYPLFEDSLKFDKNSFDAIKTMEGAAIIIHALAGKGEAWGEYLDKLPEASKSTYDKAKKSRGTKPRKLFDKIAINGWKKEHRKDMRLKVAQVLLDDPYFQKAELQYVHDFFALTKSGIISYENFLPLLEKLPDDHPRKAMAMLHRATLITYNAKNIPRGIEAYTEAIEFARKVEDKTTTNQAITHRCDVMFKNDRKEEAREGAKLIDLEILHSRDKSWAEKNIKDWLKE